MEMREDGSGMYLEMWHLTVSNRESWVKCEQLCNEVNRIVASRGWRQTIFWTPAVGRTYEIVFATDYPDLAAYEKERAERNADPEWAELFDKFDALRREGNWCNELLEQVAAPS
jgi:hypothetical protein